MPIKIKKNKEPATSRIQMNCDKGIDPRLNEHELLRVNNDLSSMAWLILGKRGSGKTSKMLEFFNSRKIFKGVFHNVFFIIPPASRNSAKAFFDKYELDDCIFDECNIETLHYVEDFARGEVHTDDVDEDGNQAFYTTALVIDDCQDVFKHADITRELGRLINNGRHYHLSVFLLCQTFRTIPTVVRSGLTGIMIFKPSLREFRVSSDELFPLEEEKKKELYNICFSKEHKLGDFLFHHFASNKYFKNFDRLLLHDDEDDGEIE